MVTFDKDSHMIIVSRDRCQPEEWFMRLRALMRVVQDVENDNLADTDKYHIMELIMDMLPGEDQFLDLSKKNQIGIKV